MEAFAGPLGAETILHCEAEPGPVTLRAAAPGFFDSSLSDSVRLVAPASALLWFDEGGHRLGRGAA